jgi:hypothetical protein
MDWIPVVVRACLDCGEKFLFLRFSCEIELIPMKFLWNSFVPNSHWFIGIAHKNSKGNFPFPSGFHRKTENNPLKPHGKIHMHKEQDKQWTYGSNLCLIKEWNGIIRLIDKASSICS